MSGEIGVFRLMNRSFDRSMAAAKKEARTFGLISLGYMYSVQELTRPFSHLSYGEEMSREIQDLCQSTSK